MTDHREIYKTLDLALRIGEVLLSSGAGAADVTATMQAITYHLGLRNAEADVTFTLLRMAWQSSGDEVPMLLSRTVTHRDIDYDDLTRVQHLIEDVLADRIGLDEARREVQRMASTGHWLPRRAVVLGSGLVGAGIALILGGGWLITVIAGLAGMAIDVLVRALSRRRLPMFYQQVAGGLFATVVAIVTKLLELPANASLVITASIVLLLSGIGFMGAIQDALTGFYVTAVARILEAMLATAGLIAGVASGLALAPRLGIHFGSVAPGSVASAPVPMILVGAIVSASAFAFSCYAPLRALPAVAMTTLLGHLVLLAVQEPGQTTPFAPACAAVVIGLVSYSIAGRVDVPPLVVVVPALVPMLPGLAIFRGLSYMSAGNTLGILQLTAAAATAIALAAGVILGEYVAQPLRRNARRLENRLAGPRMAGVLHGQLRGRKPRAPVPGG